MTRTLVAGAVPPIRNCAPQLPIHTAVHSFAANASSALGSDPDPQSAPQYDLDPRAELCASRNVSQAIIEEHL